MKRNSDHPLALRCSKLRPSSVNFRSFAQRWWHIWCLIYVGGIRRLLVTIIIDRVGEILVQIASTKQNEANCFQLQYHNNYNIGITRKNRRDRLLLSELSNVVGYGDNRSGVHMASCKSHRHRVLLAAWILWIFANEADIEEYTPQGKIYPRGFYSK